MTNKYLVLTLFMSILIMFLNVNAYSHISTQERLRIIKNADIIGISKGLPIGMGSSLCWEESRGDPEAIGKNKTNNLCSYGSWQINEMYEKYYDCYRDLVAARGSFTLGIRANVSLADILAGITGTIAAIKAGVVTGGAGAIAIGGVLAAAATKFLVPTLIHVGFFALTLVPTLTSIAAQGLVSGLPFSTTDLSAAPGSGLGGSLVSLVVGVPAFAQSALGILAAFVPIVFLASYWVTFLVTTRLLRITTAFAMGSQALLGKS